MCKRNDVKDLNDKLHHNLEKPQLSRHQGSFAQRVFFGLQYGAAFGPGHVPL